MDFYGAHNSLIAQTTMNGRIEKHIVNEFNKGTLNLRQQLWLNELKRNRFIEGWSLGHNVSTFGSSSVHSILISEILSILKIMNNHTWIMLRLALFGCTIHAFSVEIKTKEIL